MAAVFVGWTAYATFGMTSGARANEEAAAQLRAKSAELAVMQAEVARMHQGVAALKASVDRTAARLEHRQIEIAAVIGAKPGRIALADVAAADQPMATRLATLSPGAQAVLAPLLHVESRQLAFVAAATGAARARYEGATYTIRSLGLDPRRFLRTSALGMGGPLEPADGPDAAANDGDSKVQDLYLEWNKLGQLGRAVGAIPSHMPVSAFNYTSGFGVRYDPFTGGAAMHAGVDMAGTMGQPIDAAAAGTVVRAGWFGGYGNCIEIDHGKGMATRYGHLSRIEVRPGEHIEAGAEIGRMGSTGRSTGTHLHFEVRVDGRAVDPMPYLHAMPMIASVQDSAMPLGKGGPASPFGRVIVMPTR